MEDTAIHKSVGEYVDKDARKKPLPAPVIRKCGLFLPQFGPLWSPALKEDYKGLLDYVEYSPDLLAGPETADSYARQILDYVSRKRIRARQGRTRAGLKTCLSSHPSPAILRPVHAYLLV